MLRYKNTVHCAQRWQVRPLWLRNVRSLPIFTSARWWQRFARTLNPLQTGWNPAKHSSAFQWGRMCVLFLVCDVVPVQPAPVRFGAAVSLNQVLSRQVAWPQLYLSHINQRFSRFSFLPWFASAIVIGIKWWPIAAICCFVAQCQLGGGGGGEGPAVPEKGRKGDLVRLQAACTVNKRLEKTNCRRLSSLLWHGCYNIITLYIIV